MKMKNKMDCCKTKNDEECCHKLNKGYLENDKKLNGGKMNSRVALWTVIGVLFIVALFLTFKAGSIAEVSTGKTIDMAGWTENEKMNYAMHGIIPTRAGGTGSSQGSMVGGC